MEDEDKIVPNSKKAYDYLVKKGVKEHIAAGIVGNLMQESYQLDKVWATGNVDDKGSKGVMQWHGSRLQGLYDFHKKKDPNYTNGKPISLFDQLDYVLHEAETGNGDPWMKKQYEKAFKSKNAEEAAMAFSKYVLRPNAKYAHNDKRIKYASTFGITSGETNSIQSPSAQEFNPYTQPETYTATIDNVDNAIDYRQMNLASKGFNSSDNLDLGFEQQPDNELDIFEKESEMIEDIQMEQDVPPQGAQPAPVDPALEGAPQQSYTGFIQDYLDNMNQQAFGGPTNNYEHGGDMELNEFNNGGTHEENPLGGIPQGMGANGKMNTVEEGETSFDFDDGKYIFSDRLKL